MSYGSVPEKNGIRVGDVVESLNGECITNLVQVCCNFHRFFVEYDENKFCFYDILFFSFCLILARNYVAAFVSTTP